MTYDEIAGLLITRLGNRPDMAQKIEFEMVDVQENVIEKEQDFRPWFLLQEDHDLLAFTSGDEYVTLPSDFITFYEYDPVMVYDSAGDLVRTPLTEWTMDKLNARGVDENDALETGQPARYVHVGNRLYLTPVPNYNGNLAIRMYAKQARITSTTASTHPILQEASDWLMNEVGARIAQNIQNKDQLAIFAARAKQARLRVQFESERIMVGEGRTKGGEI